jgi:hypothetical protein
MKKLSVVLFVFIAACNNAETTTPSGSSGGVKIAITEYAEWRRPNGDLNGKYDVEEDMFIPCGSESGQTVDKSQIVPLSGDCDGRPGKPEPEMHLVRRTGNNFAVISDNLTLQDMEKGTAQYQTPTGTKQLIIDEETTKRIKANPALLRRYGHK